MLKYSFKTVILSNKWMLKNVKIFHFLFIYFLKYTTQITFYVISVYTKKNNLVNIGAIFEILKYSFKTAILLKMSKKVKNVNFW